MNGESIEYGCQAAPAAVFSFSEKNKNHGFGTALRKARAKTRTSSLV
ncbi:hypothetical protein CHCC20441_2333 [Bacillus licheniformis]|nr:hypothetical protein B4092_3554 [Bacillus licheniformis]TWN10523.1 hypothetical protein CHCC14564_3075 [Bacillus licheniformis LMG 17339]KYC84399.1 hypothetical protein B4091_3729 [Bacillus licheniformis]OLG03849.1 hypothetical protein B4124_1769 [Bacillus licheniformis]TWJ34338.1 hypothetical protein CHCC5026_4412 [Bacillus licheniformis]